MGIRDNFQRLIDKKTQEIRDLELKLREANAYVQAIQDSMRLLPRDQEGGTVDVELRAGTSLAKTRDVLKKAGAPLHVSEILKQIGRPTDKKSRVSLSGTLAGYVRAGKVFTRPAPNTFGLVEFGNTVTPEGDDLPEEFGSMQ
ncbi:MAG TPA: hypothetical protein VD837_13185 [Terriglobales bacterium]|nr:hypothetical protein [Terriglobales bacterium]